MNNSKTWLIVGAGGGIGRALLDIVINDPTTHRVFATHRQPVSSTLPILDWLLLDFDDTATIDHFEAALSATSIPIDYFVCCSGLLRDQQLTPEKRLADLSATAIARSCQINAGGPLATFAAAAKHLARAPAPSISFLSAQVGSIADNGTGGWYSYRMAKAALNMGVKCVSIECARWRNAPVVLAIHPGTTLTELSKPFTRRRKIPPRTSLETATLLHKTVQSTTPQQTGSFLTADGQPLPW